MMESLDLQVLQAIREWRGQGHALVLATVAATWGASPRPRGSWLAVRDDGRIAGSVSGGCIEDDLIDKMRRGELWRSQPYALTYGATRDEALNFGLPCGGILELLIEPNPDAAQLQDLAERLQRGELVNRSVNLADGAARLAAAVPGDCFQWDGKTLTTLHGPQWRLLLVGAGDIARYVAPMAVALGFDVTVCDPRDEYAASWKVPGTRLVTTMPDDAVTALVPDVHTAIIMLAHDPKLDDMALLEALPSPAFFVGALGSRRTNAQRRKRLVEHFGFTEAMVARLHGPVGLPIGSRTPPEIAVSILAQLTQQRIAHTTQAGTHPKEWECGLLAMDPEHGALRVAD
ncbi:XdhC family protein [Achromobacter piechaudii]|nr:XdhC family protein [Achromobacter piechaudii]